LAKTEGTSVKRFIVFSVVTLACLCLFAQPATSQPGGKVLLIIRDAKVTDQAYLDWVITNEAGAMRAALQKAGFRVDVANPTGEPWGTPGHAITADKKLKDVRVADYRAIVIPCMAIQSTALHPDLEAVIIAAVRQGKIVAAQNGGVTMLGKAGVLSGKRYAVSDEGGKEIKDGTRTGMGVEKDGQIITSGICPAMAKMVKGTQEGTPTLMQMLIADLMQTK
jgi:putative intracellular protease/amidase